MTILHLIDIPWWSGLASYAFDCLTAHHEMGHKVFLLCEKKSLSHQKAKHLGIPHGVMSGRRFWSAPWNFLCVGVQILKLQPQLIIAHTGSTHWAAVLWGKLLRLRIIRTRAITQKIKSGFLSRQIYRLTDHVIVASDKLKREYQEQLPLAWNEKLLSFQPPVTNLKTGSTQAQDQFPSTKKIGVLARLDPKKGHGDILKAFKIVQSHHPECELHIAGAEENLPWNQLVKRASELGLKNIWYHGFLMHEEIWNFMKSCSVGLIASRESEEVSRALLEWMNAGRPVVATAVGCIPEILQDGKGGFLIQPQDPVSMAEKLELLLRGMDLAQKMGQYNVEVALKHYAPSNFKAQWHEVIYSHIRT